MSNEAKCKTCGGSPGHHVPSPLDPKGIGDPGHAMTRPTSTPAEADQVRTSAEWTTYLLPGVKILDPDGWDRENFNFSFNKELINKREFEHRFMMSTVSMPRNVGIIWRDQNRDQGNDLVATGSGAAEGASNPPGATQKAKEV